MNNDDNSDFDAAVRAAMRSHARTTLAAIQSSGSEQSVTTKHFSSGGRRLLVAGAVSAVLLVGVGAYEVTGGTTGSSAPGAAARSLSSAEATSATPTSSPSSPAQSDTPTPSTTRVSSGDQTSLTSPTDSASLPVVPPVGPPPAERILALLNRWTTNVKLSIGSVEVAPSTSLAAVAKYLRIDTQSGGSDVPVWVVTAQTVHDGTRPNLDEGGRHVASVVIVVDAASVDMIANFESLSPISLDPALGKIYQISQ